MSDLGYGADAHAAPNNTYKAVRVIGESYNLFYSVWCTNESESFDLTTESGELRNLLSDEHDSESYTLAGRAFDHIVPRLDALMMVLKSCKGRACIEPWRELHPLGDVATLLDTLQPAYDDFYRDQPKVSFSECKLGYFPEFERPQQANQIGVELEKEHWFRPNTQDGKNDNQKYLSRWSDWT